MMLNESDIGVMLENSVALINIADNEGELTDLLSSDGQNNFSSCQCFSASDVEFW